MAKAAISPAPVLALDLNAFFASVEQQTRPELRGRPVGVVPVMSETSCCIAASYPAKAFGVNTSTPVAEAKQRCPDIVLVEARPALYVDYHERIKTAVDALAPIQTVPSIDEFICELPAGYKTWDTAATLGWRIKRGILDAVGECMTCSVGIASNAYLAKTATDMQKPDGLVLLKPEDLPQALFGLELGDLCGIGRNMERRLRAAGIDTVEQLYTASRLELRKVWGGIGGERMWANLRGLSIWRAPAERRSLGHSHVLPPDLRSDAGAAAVIHRMLQKAGMRLRRLELSAAGIGIFIRYIGKRRWKTAGRFNASDDSLTFTHYLQTLWTRRPQVRGLKPLMVGVVLFDLIETGHQTLPLFEADRPNPPLLQTIDQINLKFGKNTLHFGGAHRAKDRAPCASLSRAFPMCRWNSRPASDTAAGTKPVCGTPSRYGYPYSINSDCGQGEPFRGRTKCGSWYSASAQSGRNVSFLLRPRRAARIRKEDGHTAAAHGLLPPEGPRGA